MKLKIVTLFTTLVIATTNINAQKLPINIGVKLGANLSGVNGPSLKGDFKVGYLVGAYADLNIGKKIALQPELLFSQTTTTTANSSLIPNFEALKKINLHYMSIVALLDYKVLPFIHAQLGPQVGTLLNSNQSITTDAVKAFKSGDFSVVVGAEARFLKFRGGVRYVVGLSNINDLANQEKWKNQNVQIALSYNIL